MYAQVGDRLVVPCSRQGGMLRDAEILAVFNVDGSPPYVVRWTDTGREEFVLPPVEAYVRHWTHARA